MAVGVIVEAGCARLNRGVGRVGVGLVVLAGRLSGAVVSRSDQTTRQGAF